ncbi:hypothetical protein [Nonomuraea sp. NPDC049750]
MNERYERGLARQAELGPGAIRTRAYDALADTWPGERSRVLTGGAARLTG